MSTRRYHIIFNRNAGTIASTGLTSERLAALFDAAGLDFEIDNNDALPLSDRIERALASSADTIIAAGGDGTVLAVAAALLGSGKALAVLPLGTFNGLVRDLRLPLDLAGAVAALPTLEPRSIDVGEVNGRPFLHNVIVGLIPELAVGRETMRSKPGLSAWVWFTRFFFHRLSRSRRIALGIEADASPARVERLQTILVANNSYEQRVGRFMTRRRIDRGSLTAYFIRSLRLSDMVRLGIEMFAGRWRDDEVITFESVRRLVLHSKRSQVRVTMDGEVVTLQTPLRFSVQPASLSVLAPVEVVAAPAPISEQLEGV